MVKGSHKWKTAAAVCTLATMFIPTVSFADSSQPIAQGVGSAILQQADYFGGLDPNTQVTVDIVMKLQNQNELAQYINETTTPSSSHYRKYLNVQQFAAHYAPTADQIHVVTSYLSSFGIQSSVYPDNLVITATGTVQQFNNAFSVNLQSASFHGKKFHGTKTPPKAPASVASNILCILGLSNYSNLTSQAVPKTLVNGPQNIPQVTPTPDGNMTNKLVQQYNVQPLYDKGATGAGQTIGIVTLADFNPSDAYAYWKYNNIQVNPNRIKKINVDGGSGLSEYDGSDETSLDVEQSGALAPGANIDVYVGPNSDTGFVDAFAKAITDNVAQQISVSWGESETIIDYFVQLQMETPEYAQAFNQLFMEGAAQGISMFAAAGDSGAYAAERDLGTYNLSVLNPADSPYITAAGGTTLPYTHTFSGPNLVTGDTVSYTANILTERAWGWDYLYPYFDMRGYNTQKGIDIGAFARYFVGGGGGFSEMFPTPDYQQGVPGVNSYTAVQQWTPSSDFSTVTRLDSPKTVTGTGTGRNLPDLSMNADPETGYAVYFNLPQTDDPSSPVDSGWATYGGTSFVAPQLAGLSALINSADNTQVGFWNPQIYRFAQEANSPLHPLNDSSNNDNIFYTGTEGTLYNQATGLGTPDISALAGSFAAGSGSRNQ